jgi:hypothetical protein
MMNPKIESLDVLPIIVLMHWRDGLLFINKNYRLPERTS